MTCVTTKYSGNPTYYAGIRGIDYLLRPTLLNFHDLIRVKYKNVG